MENEGKVGEIIEHLERLERSMNRAVDKLESIERRIPPHQIGKSEPPLDVGTLLSIPDYLRTTLLTVSSLGTWTLIPSPYARVRRGWLRANS